MFTFVPCSALVVQVFNVIGLKLPFKVPFQVHRNKLSSLCLRSAVANGLERSLNISNPLEMPPEMLVYVSSITVRDFPVSRNSYHSLTP